MQTFFLKNLLGLYKTKDLGVCDSDDVILLIHLLQSLHKPGFEPGSLEEQRFAMQTCKKCSLEPKRSRIFFDRQL